MGWREVGILTAAWGALSGGLGVVGGIFDECRELGRGNAVARLGGTRSSAVAFVFVSDAADDALQCDACGEDGKTDW